MKKLWDLKKGFSNLELEEQGRGIIIGVTRLLLLYRPKRTKDFDGECIRKYSLEFHPIIFWAVLICTGKYWLLCFQNSGVNLLSQFFWYTSFKYPTNISEKLYMNTVPRVQITLTWIVFFVFLSYSPWVTNSFNSSMVSLRQTLSVYLNYNP